MKSGTELAWDPYEELGVVASASVEEIKAAFRERAKQCHPDKVRQNSSRQTAVDSEEAFRRVREAYELLTDPETRAQHDAGKLVEQRRAATVLEVDLDDMELDEEQDTYTFKCRCSGSYTISGDQLSEGYDTICCSSCSLFIRVLYESVDEAE